MKRYLKKRILTPNYIKEFKKSLCRIKIGEKIASGFFMITKINQQKVRFLITNNHVISDEMIIQKINIEIYLECINEKREIQLDNEQRLIKIFPKPIDITIVEILDSDNLKNKVKCLKRDYLEKGKGYETYLSKDILIFHHPKGGDATCSSGKILNINNYEYGHNAFTEPGSSSSAIILKDDYDDDDDYKIIGIHCRKNKKTYINY